MHSGIVFADWRLRHGQNGGRIRVKKLPENVQLASAQSLVMDLRLFGEENIAETETPVAVVRVLGEMATPIALLMRQDEEQVHFIPRPGARDVHISELEAHLRQLFTSHHLALNNFECNVHELADPSKYTHSFEISADAMSVARNLTESLRSDIWSGFHLRPGYQFQWFADTVTAFEVLFEQRLVLIGKGSKGRKTQLDDLGWNAEIYRKSTSNWCGEEVPKIRVELRPFDRTPQTVAALLLKSPLRRIGVMSYERIRIEAECAQTSLLVEIDVISCRPVSGNTQRRTYLTLRSHSARQILDGDAALGKMESLRLSLLELLDGSVLSQTSSEALPMFAQSVSDQNQNSSIDAAKKIALIGPSGSGKSTFTSELKEEFKSKGKSVAVLKLASPLYGLQKQFYAAAGKMIAEDAQNQVLLEAIAGQLRSISPTALIDHLEHRLNETDADIVLNDDLRDDDVDLPRLRALGFKVVRIVSPDSSRISRLGCRNDVSTIINSELDVQIARIDADIVVSNDSDMESLRAKAKRVAAHLLQEVK
ncbi:hypothetical protein LJR245_007556 [Rhizobium leguminosarum]